MIGIIIGFYGFAQMLLRILLGVLSDKINKRKIFVVIGILLGLLSTTGLWLFDYVLMVLILRSLTGAAVASWVTYTVTVLFSDYSRMESLPRLLVLYY